MTKPQSGGVKPLVNNFQLFMHEGKIIMRYFRCLALKLMQRIRLKMASRYGSAAYWTRHMVANDDWRDAHDSLEHFMWRNAQYPGYINLMPVDGADGLSVVDYGCGPGNDLVGFSLYSKPLRLFGLDVSKTALAASEKRLALHDKKCELICLQEERNEIPIESSSIDLVHSSGVLHHVKNIESALTEIYRILKVGGKLQVMVYNYSSIWLHLYTAYVHQIEIGLYKEHSLMEAFRRTTDGPDCPISHCYQPYEFLEMVNALGFEGRFKGASISLHELALLPKRFEAIQNRQLGREHRDFLSAISFNEFGHPLVNGEVAGINACYEFIKK